MVCGICKKVLGEDEESLGWPEAVNRDGKILLACASCYGPEAVCGNCGDPLPLDEVGKRLECPICRLSWLRCPRCGGKRPALDGDPEHPALPLVLDECPGRVGDLGLCGAWASLGWTPSKIENHVWEETKWSFLIS
jgi:hypothetical protein